jgi:ubiquinone/menaquinone biosynthesis C-methylase UbiE/PAS domain-containing protein
MAFVVDGKESDKQLDLDEVRGAVERLCRDVRRSGRYVLANPLSAAYAHQACSRILGSARARALAPGGIKWKIGIASGTEAADVTVEASRLADEAPPGHAFIAEAVHQELDPRSSSRYLPAQDVEGYRACQTIPAGYRRCFVVIPMGADGSPERAQSDCVFTRIIRPACERLKYATIHPGQQDGEDVWGDISNGLMAADHVIAYLGSPPWNPNVMLEVGYRLATAKPLVVLAPGGDLPFDLKNHRTIILPSVPSSLTDDQAEEKVAELMELTTKRVARDRGWAGLHATATIEVDRRPGIDPELRDHRITDASERTARLFAIDRAELIGMPPSTVMERLGKLMDKTQYKAFLEEQQRLYEQLSSDDAVGGDSKRTIHAEVPIVLTQHPDPAHYLRAFLPAILSNDQIGDRGLQRVVYVDMSPHIRKDDQGVYRVPRPTPNLDFVFAKYAGSYDKVLLALPHYCEAVNNHFTLVSPREGLKIMDLGAGTGNLVVRLLQAGASVSALDKSQDMLKVLRKKCQGFGDRLKVSYRDGCDLTGFSTASFDVVNVMLVMFAADRPLAMLREAVRVLRPGGALIITEPNQKFDMEALLRESEHQLRSAGRLGPAGAADSLTADWDTVKKVNQAFSDTVQEAWKSEQVEEELRGLGWEDIETTSAYNGHCTTLRATKPAS